MELQEKDYNTTRPFLIIPEYGRNIQKMIAHAVAIEDKEERNKIAKAIISIMGQLNPHYRDIADFKHKLWDHLFIISDFKLDVDSPYPIPDKETLFEKPEKMAYPKQTIRFKHYGKSVENLIEKAVEKEEGEEKQALVNAIANLMKKAYLTWNKDSVEDAHIFSDLKLLSQGQLKLEDGIQLTSTADLLALTKKKRTNYKDPKQGYKQNYKQNYKKRRY